MPLYDYRCMQCGKIFEIRHGFHDTHGDPCPDCAGTLARVFNPAPIVFKGSGFYVTDSRGSSASSNGATNEGKKADKSESVSSESAA
jgi:putative FmdB family regulatory protein